MKSIVRVVEGVLFLAWLIVWMPWLMHDDRGPNGEEL